MEHLHFPIKESLTRSFSDESIFVSIFEFSKVCLIFQLHLKLYLYFYHLILEQLLLELALFGKDN